MKTLRQIINLRGHLQAGMKTAATTMLKRIAIVVIAPFFIAGWCLLNPRKVWAQAKDDWKYGRIWRS